MFLNNTESQVGNGFKPNTSYSSWPMLPVCREADVLEVLGHPHAILLAVSIGVEAQQVAVELFCLPDGIEGSHST